MAAEVKIRWHLELVGDPSRQLLAQDRRIRSSLEQTDRLQKKLATSATQTGAAQTRAARSAAGAYRAEALGGREAQAEVERLNRAQAEALTIGGRLAASARAAASAYRAQATAATELGSAEARRARAQTGAAAAGARSSRRGALGSAAIGGASAIGSAATVGAGAALLGVGVAVKTFAGFEQQMSRVKAVSGATGAQLEAMTNQALDLGRKTSFSARQAAGGMYELSTAGFKADQVMKAIPGTLNLAAASATDLADAAAIQATALNAFGLPASKATHVADVMTAAVNRSAIEMSDLGDSLKYVAPVAGRFNQSFEDMSASVAILGNVGIKGTMAGTALRRGLVSVVKPSKRTQDALDDAGISADKFGKIVNDSHGRLRPFPTILGKLSTALQGVPAAMKRRTLAQLFGTEALPGMITLFDKGRGGIEKMSRALHNADGVAARTAHTMRHNVSGAWDNFTGSLETAAITVTRRFSPAIQDALNKAAKLANVAAAGGAGLLAGLAGDKAPVTRQRFRDEGRGGGMRTVEIAEPKSGAQKAGEKIRGALSTAASAAGKFGSSLLDALKPAQPFLENVLLPLLKGVGKGLLASIAAVVPVIRILAVALGAVGKIARPFRGVIEGIGVVIGVVFAGPILKGIAAIGKLGSVFRLVALPIRALAVPVGFLGGLVGRLGGALLKPIASLGKLGGAFTRAGALAGKLPGILGRVAGRALSAVGNLATGAAKGLSRLVSRFAIAGVSAGRGLILSISRIGGRLADVAGGLVSKIAGGFRSRLGDLVGFFGRVGKAIVNAIVGAIKSAPHAIANAVKSVIPGPVRGALKKAGGALSSLVGRRGGRVTSSGFRRYQSGGLVTAAISPGELVAYGGSAWTVPGAPTASDSVLASLPVGAAVFTGDGQTRLAAGEPASSVLRSQAPHFRTGGVVAGRYMSTAYGPPWGGIQGGGVTRTGVNLRGSPHVYGVAVDPAMIALGSSVYVRPNPFGYTGRFRAFDTGGAIKGRRLDFYDWRGRRSQQHWGRRNVTVGLGGHGHTADPGGRGSEAALRILGRSPRRAGLVEDAFSQGLEAGQGGLTRREIAAATRGARGARANPIIAAIAEQIAARDPGGNQLAEAAGGDGKAGDLRAIAARTRVPYVFGGGHGRFSRNPSGLDCSGYVSHVLHYGGAKPGLKSPAATGGLARYGRSGRGKSVTIHVRNGGAGGGHTMLTIGRYGYSSGNRATGRKSGRHDVGSSYLATLPIKRHPAGLRRGGIVGYRAGGLVGRIFGKPAGRGGLGGGVDRALTFAGGTYAALDALIGGALEGRLESLRRSIVARVRKGGPEAVVKRLQGIIDLIDFELGRRVGRILDTVQRRSDAVGRFGDAYGRLQRRGGIDPASSAGIAGGLELADKVTIPAAKRNVADLERALAKARRSGNREAIRTIGDQLATARDELDELFTSRVEQAREAIRTAAQERVDTAQFGIDRAGGLLGGLDASQRLAGFAGSASFAPLASAAASAIGTLGIRGQAADSAGGMRERAAAIATGLIPALQAARGAIASQLQASIDTGDVQGIRTATIALDQNATDLATAVGDAGELLRNATVKAVQDLEDESGFRSNLSSSGLQRLELEQRLAGTYEAGGAERASYITSTVIPALQSELASLAAAAYAYEGEGMVAEMRQAIEGYVGKQNEILQAQLDAQEQIADNTAPRQFGGTLGFGWNGETLTDSLVTIGNGL